MPGIFQGGAGGIFGGRRDRRMAAEAEAARVDTVEGLDIGVDELIASTADPAEAKAWRDRFESFKELALSQDEIQQRAGINGLGQMATEVQAAVDRRHEAQQGFIIEHARELRERHVKAITPMRELQANMEQLNALLLDPEFNQNLPINRGTLMTLLESTGRQMLTDPADFADAMMNAGAGGGLIGAVIRAAGGVLDAQDFDFTKDDFGRIARAMYTFNEKRYRSSVTPIELEAAALDQAAAGLDFLPAGYSLTQYVTGPPEAFENPLAEDYGRGSPPIPPAVETALDAIGDALTGGASDGDPERAAEGPEFGSVDRRDTGVLERATGVFDIGNELNAQISQFMQAGATVRADPQTGALFAIYEDGRREEVPTSTVKRSYVRNALEAGRTGRRRPASGSIDRSRR